jgi:hypothetical protein
MGLLLCWDDREEAAFAKEYATDAKRFPGQGKPQG